MSYKREFLDYDGGLYIPKGWADYSWHNDTMPRVVCYFDTHATETMISIWQDYVDESRRETEGEPRYIFQITKNHGDVVFEYRTDNLEEVKLLVKGVNTVRDKIKAMLDEKLNEIFVEVQSELGIKDGGIEPLMALRLDEELDKLTEMVRDVIGMQKGADA